MTQQKYIWKNGQMLPWEDVTTHVLTHSLHYGSSVFEGIRFYETKAGPAIFKLEPHIKRLFYSASHLGMEIPYTEAELCEACIETIKTNKINQGYIRPLVYYGHGPLKVAPHPDLPIETVIAVWPWGKYMAHDILDVKTSDFIRIHPKSTIADAKICGHYVNSILATLAIKNTHYHESLLLDADGYVAEGTAENIFIVKDGTLITTPPGTILVGITRNTVIEIAQHYDIPVEERKFTPEDVINADEAFFCGTAVEVIGISSLDDQIIGTGTEGPVTKKVKNIYLDMVYDRLPEFHNNLTMVEQK